ncbi:MAG: chromate transporter, partial [Clostridia bacterium]|nr:chromate transporter [Clostridia bacterium]
LAGLRPAVIAMIASAGISLLIMAIYGQRALPDDLMSLDMIAVVIFLIGFFILRKWKPNPLWVMAGSGVAGIILYYL